MLITSALPMFLFFDLAVRPPVEMPGAAVRDRQIEDAQAELDAIWSPIDPVLNSQNTSTGYEITEISTALERLRVGQTSLRKDEEIAVDIEVVRSLEAGGVQLTLNDYGVVDSSFEIEVCGQDGCASLAFVSGTFLSDLAAAIDTFRLRTGVRARLSGAGVTLVSARVGDEAFVSVRTLGVPSQGGIAELAGTHPPVADPDTFLPWHLVSGQQIVDHGQDLAVLYEGEPVETRGTRATIAHQRFVAEVDLRLGTLGIGETANASNIGELNAFVIRHAEASGPVSRMKKP